VKNLILLQHFGFLSRKKINQTVTTFSASQRSGDLLWLADCGRFAVALHVQSLCVFLFFFAMPTIVFRI